MAKSARDEQFDEIADWFETLAKAERSHANRFQKSLDAVTMLSLVVVFAIYAFVDGIFGIVTNVKDKSLMVKVADNVKIEVTKTAQEAGIRFPVFLSRAVYDAYVTVPPDVTSQDEAGRLWDIVWMLRFAIIRSKPGHDRLPVALYVRNDNQAARLVKLVATCGPLDIDDPAPAITVMLPDED